MPINTALFNWSLKFTSIANASLLANSAPIFVVMAAWLFLAERFKPIFIVGLITALSGATILVGPSYQLGLENLFGDALALLTAVLYSGYILSIKRLRHTFQRPGC
jgi:drug/metabolite transporter (DMT)-like permease